MTWNFKNFKRKVEIWTTLSKIEPPKLSTGFPKSTHEHPKPTHDPLNFGHTHGDYIVMRISGFTERRERVENTQQ